MLKKTRNSYTLKTEVVHRNEKNMNSLVSDLDGTLYFHQRIPHIRAQDVEKISQLRITHKFGICTGRPPVMLSCLEEYQIECDFLICISGALILDRNKKIIFEKTMPSSQLQAILEKTNPYMTAFLARDSIYLINKKEEFKVPYTEIQTISQIDKDIIGISVRTPSEHKANQLCKILSENPQIAVLQNNSFVDIIPSGCSKGTALHFIKNYEEIEEIGAVGDSYNDIDMLENASCSFAMCSAPEEVKKASQYTVNYVAEAIDILLRK